MDETLSSEFNSKHKYSEKIQCNLMNLGLINVLSVLEINICDWLHSNLPFRKCLQDDIYSYDAKELTDHLETFYLPYENNVKQ